MQKKIARKIASITAVSLASGLITVPAGANADLTPNLQIMQKTEIISDEALDQSYQYDYQSDGNDQKFTQVETSWDNAFVAKKLVVGDWKNYDGDVVVSILKDDGMEMIGGLLIVFVSRKHIPSTIIIRFPADGLKKKLCRKGQEI